MTHRIRIVNVKKIKKTRKVCQLLHTAVSLCLPSLPSPSLGRIPPGHCHGRPEGHRTLGGPCVQERHGASWGLVKVLIQGARDEGCDLAFLMSSQMKLCAENQGPGPWFLGGEVESGLETPTQRTGSAQGDSVCEMVHGGVGGHAARRGHGQVLLIIRVCVCERKRERERERECVCVCVYAGMFRAVCSDSRLEAH